MNYFQVLISVCSYFLCQSSHVSQFEAAAMMAAGPAGPQMRAASNMNNSATSTFNAIARRAAKGPSWVIILGFTAAFVTTYPVHMYVAEVYIHDRFTFLFVKYCLGFLHVIFVPLITLSTQEDIRVSIKDIFGSAVICAVADMDDDDDNNDIQPVDNGRDRQA